MIDGVQGVLWPRKEVAWSRNVMMGTITFRIGTRFFTWFEADHVLVGGIGTKVRSLTVVPTWQAAIQFADGFVCGRELPEDLCP